MLSYRMATSVEDLIEAWSMIYKRYLHGKLLNPNPYEIWVFPEYLLGNSLTLSAYDNNVIVATVSIVWGDELPLDHYYSEEIDGLRDQYGTIMEMGLNAKISIRTPREVILSLEAIATAIMRNSLNCTYAICGVHPLVARTYEKRFGFAELGEDKKYRSLNNAPVRLLHGDVTDYMPVDISSYEIPKLEERIILNKKQIKQDERLLAFSQVRSA